jgi:uncharacterized protein YceH (UPF0502 family)
LRTGSDRLHRFADVGSVEGYLDELASRPTEQGGPLVVLLPRRPGTRESRWAHLLSGAPTDELASPAEATRAVDNTDLAALRDEVQRLASEVAALKDVVQRLAAGRNDGQS